MFSLLSFLLLAGCVEDSFISNKLSRENAVTEEQFKKYLSNIDKRLAKLKIDYVCPASDVSENFQKTYVSKLLNSVIIPDEILHCSQADKLDQFKKAIQSDSKIIWAMRGGYGSYKFPEMLDKYYPSKKNKTLIGFSDITALNLYVSQHWKNWQVIHGAVFSQIISKKYAMNNILLLLDILEHKIENYSLDDLVPLNHAAKIAKNITGRLTGGNLTLIENSIGTCWEIKTEGKIIFIEDCNESPQSIYRSLYHLKTIGKFSKAKAILFGKFEGNYSNYNVYLIKFADELGIPVFQTELFGHGYYNYPLVYNSLGEISAGVLKVRISD